MGKDVTIEVPCAHMELRAKPPEEIRERATIHMVAVPSEALAEVQEVLKKYQPQMQKFNELLQKVAQQKNQKKAN